MSGGEIFLSRRVWAGLCTALPCIALSLRYFDVYFDPGAGANQEWAEDAKLLVRLELLLVFVAALTVSIAARVSALSRVATMSALAILFGGIVYALWIETGRSDVILGAGLLIAGRFLTAVIAGPDAAPELIERAAVGTVFYFAILFLVFVLPEMLPHEYRYLTRSQAPAFCAVYYLLHALVEAAQIYARSAEPAVRRLTVDLERSDWILQRRLQLRFAGDAVEIVRSERMRPAARILAFFFGSIFVGLGLGAIIATRGRAIFPAVIPLLMGGAIAVNSLRRGGGSAWTSQVRNGEIAVLQYSRGKLESMNLLAAAGIDRLRVARPADARDHTFQLWADVHGGDATVILYGLEFEPQAATLKRLVELYLKGDVRPPALRKALEADPGLAAMLGPKVVERLLAAAPMPERAGTMACPGCGTEIAANAPRCAYCGLMHPALDA